MEDAGFDSNEDVYEVEKIIDVRLDDVGRLRKYRVRWKGCGSDDDTWEPKDNLLTCDDLLKAFEADRAELSKKRDERRKKLKKKKKTPPMLEVPIQVKAEPISDNGSDFEDVIKKKKEKDIVSPLSPKNVMSPTTSDGDDLIGMTRTQRKKLEEVMEASRKEAEGEPHTVTSKRKMTPENSIKPNFKKKKRSALISPDDSDQSDNSIVVKKKKKLKKLRITDESSGADTPPHDEIEPTSNGLQKDENHIANYSSPSKIPKPSEIIQGIFGSNQKKAIANVNRDKEIRPFNSIVPQNTSHKTLSKNVSPLKLSENENYTSLMDQLQHKTETTQKITAIPSPISEIRSSNVQKHSKITGQVSNVEAANLLHIAQKVVQKHTTNATDIALPGSGSDSECLNDSTKKLLAKWGDKNFSSNTENVKKNSVKKKDPIVSSHTISSKKSHEKTLVPDFDKTANVHSRKNIKPHASKKSFDKKNISSDLKHSGPSKVKGLLATNTDRNIKEINNQSKNSEKKESKISKINTPIKKHSSDLALGNTTGKIVRDKTNLSEILNSKKEEQLHSNASDGKLSTEGKKSTRTNSLAKKLPVPHSNSIKNKTQQKVQTLRDLVSSKSSKSTAKAGDTNDSSGNSIDNSTSMKKTPDVAVKNANEQSKDSMLSGIFSMIQIQPHDPFDDMFNIEPLEIEEEEANHMNLDVTEINDNNITDTVSKEMSKASISDHDISDHSKKQNSLQKLHKGNPNIRKEKPLKNNENHQKKTSNDNISTITTSKQNMKDSSNTTMKKTILHKSLSLPAMHTFASEQSKKHTQSVTENSRKAAVEKSKKISLNEYKSKKLKKRSISTEDNPLNMEFTPIPNYKSIVSDININSVDKTKIIAPHRHPVSRQNSALKSKERNKEKVLQSQQLSTTVDILGNIIEQIDIPHEVNQVDQNDTGEESSILQVIDEGICQSAGEAFGEMSQNEEDEDVILEESDLETDLEEYSGDEDGMLPKQSLDGLLLSLCGIGPAFLNRPCRYDLELMFKAAVEHSNRHSLKPGANTKLLSNVNVLQAILQGNEDLVIECKISEEDINEFVQDGDTLLMKAVMECAPEMVQILLEKNADPNKLCTNGKTPLMVAVELKQKRLVLMLIQNGALLNIQTSNGETALIMACKLGHLEIIHVLMNSGADVCPALAYLEKMLSTIPIQLQSVLQDTLQSQSDKLKDIMEKVLKAIFDSSKIILNKALMSCRCLSPNEMEEHDFFFECDVNASQPNVNILLLALPVSFQKNGQIDVDFSEVCHPVDEVMLDNVEMIPNLPGNHCLYFIFPKVGEVNMLKIKSRCPTKVLLATYSITKLTNERMDQQQLLDQQQQQQQQWHQRENLHALVR